MVHSIMEELNEELSRARHHWYDWEKGWDGTNVGWYQVKIPNSDRGKHLQMVAWVYKKIDNPERHSRWCHLEDYNEHHEYLGEYSAFKFRYEKDFILFRLSWE